MLPEYNPEHQADVRRSEIAGERPDYRGKHETNSTECQSNQTHAGGTR